MLNLASIAVFLYFLPGFFLLCLFDLKRWRFFFSLSLSLLLFAICLASLLFWNLTWSQITAGYLFIVLVLAVLAMYKIFVGKTFSLLSQNFKAPDLFIFVSIVVVYGIYLSVVGPYDEVPSDFYRHLERIQLIRWNLETSGSRITTEHLWPNGYYIYYIYAVSWFLSDTALEDAILFFSWFHGVIVITSLYFFSTEWLARTFKTPRLLAVAACLLFVLHQGVIQFAFLRYYALSATLVCLPLVFLAAITFVKHTEEGITKKEQIVALACTAAPIFYHFQEALFITIIIWLLSAYYSAVYLRGVFKQRSFSLGLNGSTTCDIQLQYPVHALIAFAVLTVGFIALYVFSLGFIPKTPPDPQKILTLPFSFPIIGAMHILNPAYQFLQTIGAFGILIYACFFLFAKRFSRDSFLFIGMLTPVFTVWNPLFVDIFLRLRDAHVLYRIGYMIPFTITGAYIFGMICRSRSMSLVTRSALLAGWLAACTISLVPWTTDTQIFHYSRLHTLMPVAKDLSYRHWEDMISFLREYRGRRNIYTDPVTGYLVSALTKHVSIRYKFTTGLHKPINFPSYVNEPLSAYEGGLLIINLRQGGLSQSGLTSGHWPVDVLKLRKYYSTPLLEQIRSNPESFPLIWTRDDVSIYEIYPKKRGASQALKD